MRARLEGVEVAARSEPAGPPPDRQGPMPLTRSLRRNAAGGQLDPAAVNPLPALVRHDVLYAISHAIQGVFVWAAPSAVFVFVPAWFIKEVSLRGRAPSSEAPVGEPELVA